MSYGYDSLEDVLACLKRMEHHFESAQHIRDIGIALGNERLCCLVCCNVANLVRSKRSRYNCGLSNALLPITKATITAAS
jgi:hypothetical protein